jgi:hypothetical protein
VLFVRKRKLKIPGILALIAALVLIATELQAGGTGNIHGGIFLT